MIGSTNFFYMLCDSLDMSFVCDEDTDYFIKKNEYGENAVYYINDGHDELMDDRGDLFVALRNVAVNMFPNVLYRSAEYIYKNGELNERTY